MREEDTALHIITEAMIRLVATIVIATGLIAGTLTLPLEVPYTVSAPGKVLPAIEWHLVRDQDGSVSSTLRNNIEGVVLNYDLHQFERGDAVRFRLNPSLRPYFPVAAGDTVLRIHSNEAERRLAALAGRLETAQSAVSYYTSGAKEAEINRAQKSLERALQQAELQRKEMERLRTLRERQLIAEREFETAESRMKVLDAEVEIARAELDALLTGAKPEQVELAQTEATAFQREMLAMAERLTLLTIRAPISGKVIETIGTDTLLTVRDTSAAVVVMAVPWKKYGILRIGQAVQVEMGELPVSMSGHILRFGETVHRLGGEQVMLVTVLIGKMPEQTVAGALAQCTIETDPVRLLEYVRRSIL